MRRFRGSLPSSNRREWKSRARFRLLFRAPASLALFPRKSPGYAPFGLEFLCGVGQRRLACEVRFLPLRALLPLFIGKFCALFCGEFFNRIFVELFGVFQLIRARFFFVGRGLLRSPRGALVGELFVRRHQLEGFPAVEWVFWGKRNLPAHEALDCPQKRNFV